MVSRTSAFPPVTEHQFARTVKDLARVHGWMIYHTFLSVRSEPGFPDLVLVKPPRCIFAELKSEKGKLTPDQGDWTAALHACPGVETYVWKPSDWPEIVAVLGRK